MKESTQKWIGGLLAIVIIAVVVDVAFYDFIPGFGPALRAEKPGPVWTSTQKQDYENGIGMFEMSQTGYDSLAPATARAHGTVFNLFWYTKRGTTYAYHGTGGTVASPVYVDMTSEDGGYMYVAVDIISSQNHHIDVDKIKATNSWIEQALWMDIDGDTVNEFVFKYDMKGHSIPNSGYPAVTFHVHCFADDTSFTAVSSLSDLGDIADTKNTQWMEWDITFSAVALAVPLAKIEVKTNVTDTTLFKLKQIEIPGRGFLDASNLVFDELSTYYRWTYTYGLTYDTAYYLTCPTGTKLTRDTDVKGDFTTGGSGVLVTLTIWYIDPETGSLSSDTDGCAAY